MGQLVRGLLAALDRPLPDIYDQTRRSGPMGFGMCLVDEGLRPVLAPRADFLRADDETAAFLAARALSLLEPERVLSVLFSESELRSILTWILGRGDDRELGGSLDESVASRNRPDQHEQLLCAREALAAIDWEGDFERWLRAVIMTADRTGFVLSGSLNASARVVAGSRRTPAGLKPTDRIFELLRFSVTDEHAAVRRHLCARV